MRPVKPLLLAAALTTALAAPALAQSRNWDVDPVPGAPDGYVGAGKQAFYSVEQRMAALEDRVASGRASRSVRAELAALKAFEARQRARHGGELRDWDREAISARLNRIEAMAPG